jgi:hypothetical protein
MAPVRKKSTGKEPQVQPIIRHPLRDGFNAYIVLSLGTGLSCPHRRADRIRATWSQRRETRTTRFCVRIGAVRLHEGIVRVANTSIASRLTCRDDRDTPSASRRDAESKPHISEKRK